MTERKTFSVNPAWNARNSKVKSSGKAQLKDQFQETCLLTEDIHESEAVVERHAHEEARERKYAKFLREGGYHAGHSSK